MTSFRCSIVLGTFLFLLSALYFYSDQQESSFHRPSISTIEKSLFEYIDQERKNRNLPLLKLSAELSAVARKHSRDMAARSELSHLSSSGKTYEERLVQDGLFFIDIGENVAFSETFRADIIHQSLMKSKDHKENILMPNFDRVGIGVIYSENSGYYITQDFLRYFEAKTAPDIKKLVQERIEHLRRSRSLPSLIYRDTGDKFALEYSKRKLEKKPPPPFPPEFGETHLIFMVTPSLEETESLIQDVTNAFYGAAGLGVTFSRNSDYPGGAYFITLVLFPDLKLKNMELDKLRQIVLREINNIRGNANLDELRLDSRISEEATRISLYALSQEEKPINIPPRLDRSQVITYITEAPDRLPQSLKNMIKTRGLRRIGIGVLFGKSTEYPQGAFWITVAFN